MKKLMFLLLLTPLFLFVSPERASAQVDSTCQIFGTGGTLSITSGSVKRFYTKFIPGAIYGWSVVGSNAVIVGPRNLHYVDVQGLSAGNFTLCVSYSVDGQAPCCVCVTASVTSGGGGGGGTCCIYYVNSTLQSNYVKVKFRTCAPGVVRARLFHWTGSAYVQIDEDNWPSGYNPAYTYNMEVYNISCNQILCLRICGYLADGTECCTSNFAIRIDCDPSNTYFTGVTDITYPGCNAPGGGGGGINSDRITPASVKLSLRPNPASSNLTVDIPGNISVKQLKLNNRAGITVKTVAVNGRPTVIVPVSDLKPGPYIIAADNPKVATAEFIKE